MCVWVCEQKEAFIICGRGISLNILSLLSDQRFSVVLKTPFDKKVNLKENGESCFLLGFGAMNSQHMLNSCPCFSDIFTCPFCRLAFQAIQIVAEKYSSSNKTLNMKTSHESGAEAERLKRNPTHPPPRCPLPLHYFKVTLLSVTNHLSSLHVQCSRPTAPFAQRSW